jgi:transcriptional regulator with XRE-family HTH domain/Zn-dependent peptidase ImmA (M78 family)
MAETNVLGAKVKALRRREGMTQIELAKRLDVSPSYLNLIENSRRPLTASLLLALAKVFQLDLATFAAADDDARSAADLLEVFGDSMFETHGITNADVRELCASSPNVARAILTLYRSYVDARTSAETLAERVSDGQEATGVGAARLPSEEVGDMIQHHMNYFPEIEEAAEGLLRTARIDPEDVYRGLTRYLAESHGVEVRTVRVADERKAMRRFDPERRLLSLSEVLPPRSRRFQLAHQAGLLSCSAVFDKIAKDEAITTPESRALARVALANYFAAAVLMPYGPFLDAAKAERYDIELLAHRFGASFEQVCHRLTTLRRPGAEGIPFPPAPHRRRGQHLEAVQRLGDQDRALLRRLPPVERAHRLPHPRHDPRADLPHAGRGRLLLHRAHDPQRPRRVQRAARHARHRHGLRDQARQAHGLLGRHGSAQRGRDHQGGRHVPALRSPRLRAARLPLDPQPAPDPGERARRQLLCARDPEVTCSAEGAVRAGKQGSAR